MSIRIRSLALVALTVLLGACEKGNVLDDSLVTVTDLSDIFTFSVVGLENVTDSRRYFPFMSADTVIVDVTSALTDGNVYLQVRTADGTVVYGENVGDEIDTVTSATVAGIWQVDIIFQKASGGFGIRLERDTVP
jgi:hypothetical protein